MGAVYVISGPSGAGKTTLCREVMRRLPHVRMSVSHTTRPPRNGEHEGVDYHFVDRATFERMAERGEFAECATVHKHLYGTSQQELNRALHGDVTLLVEIDTQGAQTLKHADIPASFIFILPPDLEVLRDRLVHRRTDSAEAIRDRLDTAARELDAAEWYDHTIVNDRLDDTVQQLTQLVRAGSAPMDAPARSPSPTP